MKRSPVVHSLFLLIFSTIPAGAAETELVQEELTTPHAAIVQSPSEVGRYLLFDGQLSGSGMKVPEVPERLLLKIDTVTGQTWIGKQIQFVNEKGKLVYQRYWEPFEQYREQPAAPAAQGR